MFLTQIKLDTNNHRIYKDLTNLRAIHGYIEQAFPAEQLLHVRKRHLWRLDGQTILLLSEDKPDTSRLKKYAKTVKMCDYTPVLKSVKAGAVYRFKITANPTMVGFHKRIGAYNTNEIIKWFKHQAELHGFTFEEATVTNKEKHRIPHHAFELQSATLTGYLKVTDPDKFINALTTGIGREKAYGMGLLSVA